VIDGTSEITEAATVNAIVLRRRLLFPVLLLLAGCQGPLATFNYKHGFEGAILRMYEDHVLANLGRRANGRFIIQMQFGNFASNVTYGTNMSGELDIFDTSNTITSSPNTVEFNPGFWTISPNVGSSLSGHAGFVANPASNQDQILALYDAEVEKPPETRLFFISRNSRDASRCYRSVNLGHGEWACVPKEMTRQFADFVTRVSFYRPEEPPAP